MSISLHELNMTQQLMAGIDIGGTKIAVAIAAAEGKIIARDSFATDGVRSPLDLMNQALETIERLAETQHGRLAAIGIGCAGPLDLERGVVLAPPNMPRNWRQFPLRSFVESKFSLPVIVDNDANAAALRSLSLVRSPPLILNVTGAETVSVRRRGSRDEERGVALDAFVDRIKKERAEKALPPDFAQHEPSAGDAMA